MENNSYLGQINSSGFPFQIRVEQEIKNSFNVHKWSSIGLEHRWINKDSGSEGFIDIVLEKQIAPFFSYYIVIECKRFSGGNWVFLNYEQINLNDSILFTSYKDKNDTKIIWTKKNYYPDSLISSFCAVPGQSDKDTPMLERISDRLLDALESIATKKLQVDSTISDSSVTKKAMFIPVIITNTELISCKFSPDDVDLLNGSLEKDKGNFEDASFIRFQKTFNTRYGTENVPNNLKDANKDSERTVWIVRAQNIPNFLQQWESK